MLAIKLGRRRSLSPDHVKSTVTLLNHHLVWLDRLSVDIRSNTMAIIDRGAIIRALVGAFKESDMNLTNVKTEEEARELILAKLKS